MSQNVHVLAFSGSLRKHSLNSRLLRIAEAHLPDGMTMEIISLSPLPFYNEDLRAHGYPPAVARFRGKIRHADAILIACPEYNYSVTGALKNALDWASRWELDEKPGSPSPLYGKPLGIVGVGGRFGTVRAQLALRQIAVFLNMHPVNKPEVLISNVPTPAFDADGNLNDPMSLHFLKEHLVALRDLTLTLNPRREAARTQEVPRSVAERATRA